MTAVPFHPPANCSCRSFLMRSLISIADTAAAIENTKGADLGVREFGTRCSVPNEPCSECPEAGDNNVFQLQLSTHIHGNSNGWGGENDRQHPRVPLADGS
jgi:hypothetical protein